MHNRNRTFTAAVILAACAALRCALASTPAEDRLWATRVLCELQEASPVSLQDLAWQQGTTPLLSLDQLRNGRAVDADTNAVAIVRFGPSQSGNYFVTATNYATSGNGFLVQMPTIGTNAAAWWYTAYYERAGAANDASVTMAGTSIDSPSATPYADTIDAVNHDADSIGVKLFCVLKWTFSHS